MDDKNEITPDNHDNSSAPGPVYNGPVDKHVNVVNQEGGIVNNDNKTINTYHVTQNITINKASNNEENQIDYESKDTNSVPDMLLNKFAHWLCKKLSRREVIILICVLVVILFTFITINIIYPFTRNSQSEKTTNSSSVSSTGADIEVSDEIVDYYNDKIKELGNKANDAFFDTDFDTAKKYYKEIEKIAPEGTEANVSAYVFQYICEFYHGIYSNSADECHRHMTLCSKNLPKITDNQEYEEYDSYYLANAILSNTYDELGMSRDDPLWKPIIKRLEDKVDKIDLEEIKNFSYEESDVYTRVYEALISYYEPIYNSNPKGIDKNLNLKICAYCEALIGTRKIRAIYRGTRDNLIEVEPLFKLCYLLLDAAHISENPKDSKYYLDFVSDICKEEKSNIEGITESIIPKVQLRLILGLCNIDYADYTKINNTKKMRCLSDAYNNLKYVLYVSNPDNDNDLTTLSATAAERLPELLGCTDEDINQILQICKAYMNIDTVESADVPSKNKIRIRISSVCRDILQIYGYSKQIYTFGKKITKDLHDEFIMEDDTQDSLKTVNQLYRFFREYNPKSAKADFTKDQLSILHKLRANGFQFLSKKEQNRIKRDLKEFDNQTK